MKARIGYTTKYIEIKDIYDLNNYKDKILQDLNEENIICSYCKQIIRKDNWISIIHNPLEKELAIRLHFFCFDKKCLAKWGKISEDCDKGLIDRSKILNGDF